MTVVDFVRHGATTMPGALLGRTDPPLSETGRQTIAAMAMCSPAWSRVLASPRKRARETAALIAPRQEASIDGAWAELDFGAWDGQRIADLQRDHGAALIAFYADPLAQPAPGGEDPVGFADRIEAALAQLVATRDPGPILVATHAGVIRTAIARACAVPFAMLWSMRIDYGTRVRLKIGLGADGQLWGEVRELVQPVERP